MLLFHLLADGINNGFTTFAAISSRRFSSDRCRRLWQALQPTSTLLGFWLLVTAQQLRIQLGPACEQLGPLQHGRF